MHQPPRLLAGIDPARHVLPDFLASPRPGLWLARTQVRRQFLEEASQATAHAGAGGRFFTLAEYVRAMHERLPQRRHAISALQQLRLIQRLLEVEGQQPGSLFRQAERRPGLAARARQLIAHLKQEMPAGLADVSGGVDPAATAGAVHRIIDAMQRLRKGEQALPPISGLAERLREPVVRLTRAYQAELQKLGLVDDEDIFLIVEAALSSGVVTSGVLPGYFSLSPSTSSTAPYEQFVVEGWYLPNSVQRRLIERLTALATQPIALVEGLFDEIPLPNVGGADRVQSEVLKFWTRLGASCEESEPPTALPTGILTLARRFSAGPAKYVDETPMTERRIAAWPATSEATEASVAFTAYERDDEEVRGIARRIVRLRREALRRGEAMPSIAVLFPSLDAATPLVEEIFSRHGIPFRLVNRVALARTAPARIAGELFDLVRMGFPRRQTLAFLASPLVDLRRPDGSRHPLDMPSASEWRQLDNLLREARFAGGRGAAHWRRRWERWRQNTARRLERLGSDAAPGEEAEPDSSAMEANRLRQHVEVMERTGLAAVTLLEAWEELAAKTSAIDLAQGWIDAFRALGLLQGLRPRGADWTSVPRPVLGRDLSAYGDVLQAIAEVGRLLSVERDGQTTMEVFEREVRAALDTGELVADPPVPADAVVVLSRLDARQMGFDHLFMAGMTAGAVPGRQRANIFFTEDERERASMAGGDDEGGGWRTHRDTIDEWRHLLAMALVRSRRVVFSWTRASEEDAPSLLLDDLARADGWNPEELLAKAAAATTPEIEQPGEAMSTRDRCLHLGEAWRRDKHKAPLPILAANWNGDGAKAAAPTYAGELATLRTSPMRLRMRLGAALQRSSDGAPHVFDGALPLGQHPAEDSPLGSLVRGAANLSVTAMETYALCPFRAMGDRLLDLGDLEESGEDPEAWEIGRALHDSLAHVFEEVLVQEGVTWGEALRWTPTMRADAARRVARALESSGPRLAKAFREEAASIADPEEDPFWAALIARWCQGLEPGQAEGARNPLVELLRLQSGALSASLPVAIEASFGTKRGRMRLVEEPIPIALRDTGECLPLRGIVDRIDLAPSQSGDSPTLLLFDYKSGEAPSVADMVGGYRFQLPLYLRAVQQAMGQIPLGGAYYLSFKQMVLKPSGFSASSLSEGVMAALAPSRRRRSAEPDPTADEIVAASLAHAGRLCAAAAHGTFATGWLGGKTMGCEDCRYRRSCRVDHDAKARWRYSTSESGIRVAGVYLPE